MDGMINSLNQTQAPTISNDNKVTSAEHTKTQEAPKLNSVQEIQKAAIKDNKDGSSINSSEEVEQLVSELNKALAPINTNLKFGVDTNDTFYVSINDSTTGRMIRRFPAEEAKTLLPKMQDVSGALLDTRS